MNNILCDRIGRSRFGTEDHSDRRLWLISRLNVHIFVNNIQCIHLLSLIFMQTFDLNIKDGMIVDRDSLFILQILLKFCLLGLFHIQKSLDKCRIICKFLQVFQFRSILFITLTDHIRDQRCQFMVTMQQPAAECDTVCLVIELIWINILKRLQLTLL